MPKAKIEIGMLADEVLEIMPRDTMTRDPVIIGKDEDGMVVEWHYPEMILEMRRAKREGELPLEAYCVVEIKEIENDKTN